MKFQEHLGRFTHIVVDAKPTKHQDNSIHIIFAATRDGQLKKLSYNTWTRDACLIEVLSPFASGRRVNIHNMKLVQDTNALYLATEENVMRLPTHRCQRFLTQRACLNAMDPYCGWNKQQKACTSAPNNNPRAGYWQQSLVSCPILSDPVSNALLAKYSWAKRGGVTIK